MTTRLDAPKSTTSLIFAHAYEPL